MASTRKAERRRRRREREARRRSEERGEEVSSQKSVAREWLEAILFAVIVVLIVRTLFFDLFRIPSPSMENSLLVGDYLFVSKVHYGPRTPMTLGIPFTDVYVPGLELPYWRLPGFTSIERNDNIVFNWPEADGPIDRKMHYIKRVIGMPGEEVSIEDKVVYLNGEPMEFGEDMQHLWQVTMSNPRARLPQSRLRTLGVNDVRPMSAEAMVAVTATRSAAEEIESWPYVEEVVPYIHGMHPEWAERLYPEGSSFTPDNYGPIQIPQAGMTVELTQQTWALYEPVISRFEGRTTSREANASFVIDGSPATEYTFEQDYYFVLGDNRDNSEDSRYWGFVPESHIVGKAIFVYFSWDSEDNFPRFNRIFHRIR